MLLFAPNTVNKSFYEKTTGTRSPHISSRRKQMTSIEEFRKVMDGLDGWNEASGLGRDTDRTMVRKPNWTKASGSSDRTELDYAARASNRTELDCHPCYFGLNRTKPGLWSEMEVVISVILSSHRKNNSKPD